MATNINPGANTIDRGSPAAQPEQDLSSTAFAANQLGSEKLKQESARDADAKLPPKAKKDGAKAEEKIVDGFEKALKNMPAAVNLETAVLQTEDGAVSQQMLNELLQGHFTELASRLMPPSGRPGPAFTPDSPRSKTAALFYMSAPIGTATEKAEPPAGLPRNEQRAALLEAIKAHTRVSEKLLDRQRAESQRDHDLYAAFSPHAKALLEKATECVAQAFAAQREQEAFVEDRDMVEMRDGAPRPEHEVEIPSPALIKLEQASAHICEALRVELEARKASPQLAGASAAMVSEGGATKSAIGPVTVNEKRPNGDIIAFLDKAIFSTGDVMALASLVMMQGCQLQDNMIRDMLIAMQQRNKQKDALRTLAAKTKENTAHLDSALRTELAELQSKQLVSAKVSFDDYKAWRQCAYGAMQENHAESGDVSYQMPEAQLAEPSPLVDHTIIPEWMKTGDTQAARANSANALTSEKYCIPREITTPLAKIFAATKRQDITFDQWLQDEVGLAVATDLSGAATNADLVCQYIKNTTGEVIVPPPPVAPKVTNPQPPADLKDAAIKWAKASILAEFFPEAVDSDKLNELKVSLDELCTLRTPPLTPEEAAAFKTWMASSASGGFVKDMEKYRKQVADLRARYTDPDNYEVDREHSVWISGGVRYLGSSDEAKKYGWFESIERWHGQPAILIGRVPDYRYPGEPQCKFSVNISPDGTVGFDAFNPNVELGDKQGPIGYPVGLTSVEWDIHYKLRGDKVSPGDAKIFDDFKDIAVDHTTSTSFSSIASSNGDAFDPKAAAADLGITATQSQNSDAKSDYDDAVKAANDLIANVNNAIASVGDIMDPNSKWRKFARDTCKIDTEWNEEQAQKHATEKPNPLTKPPSDPIDPSTRIPLTLRGSFDAISAAATAIENKLDSLKDMADVDNIRLQKLMDGRAKLLETLSNMIKSDSNTARTIRDNIK